MKKKTIIFFPFEVGLAHIVRSLAIAEELHSKGHKIIFALPKRKHEVVKNTPVELADVYPTVESDIFESITVFRDYKILTRQVEQEIELIKKYQPDYVVVDYRLSALISAATQNIKTFFVVHGSGLPYGSYLPNPGLPKLIYQLTLPIARMSLNLGERIFLQPLLKVSRKYGNKMDLDTLFQSLNYILPEPSFYFPAINKNLKLNYVGALEWKGFRNDPPEWLKEIKPDGKTIYLTFGGTGFAPQNLINLSLSLVEKDYRVIVSTGTICDPEKFPKLKNLFVSRFLPGKEVCDRVDMVVCHGGYGTLIEAIYSGKPVISIPFNPEQLMHAWRIEELGLGYCLLKLKLTDLIGLFRFRWKVFEEAGKKTEPEKVFQALELIEKNRDQIKKSLEWFNQNHPYRNGASEAVDIIES